MTARKDLQTDSPEDRDMSSGYLKAVSLIEHLHRQLLDLLKASLEGAGQNEVNNVQALLLYNIGDSELSAGELRSRGHYHGSNVSYNLKKLVDAGYIHHERSQSDRRSVRVRLTPKGQAIRNIVNDCLEAHQPLLSQSERLDENGLETLNQTLLALEEFWRSRLVESR
ncbi:MAG: MarR family winged helix-turn-helix transcriptional regulator [Pseudomonadota bacterium]|jgi:DNA-binding MarR family transcriptional regulator|nr:MarR family transcriptional regulator [Alphaproteobacteria bacterium]